MSGINDRGEEICKKKGIFRLECGDKKGSSCLCMCGCFS